LNFREIIGGVLVIILFISFIWIFALGTSRDFSTLLVFLCLLAIIATAGFVVYEISVIPPYIYKFLSWRASRMIMKSKHFKKLEKYLYNPKIWEHGLNFKTIKIFLAHDFPKNLPIGIYLQLLESLQFELTKTPINKIERGDIDENGGSEIFYFDNPLHQQIEDSITNIKNHLKRRNIDTICSFIKPAIRNESCYAGTSSSSIYVVGNCRRTSSNKASAKP
jgi:hypothetical protein